MVKLKTDSKSIFIIAFILIILLAIFTVRSFVMSIIAAGVLAYLFYPIYGKINNKIKMKNLSASVVLILIILVLTIPLYFSFNAVAKEARFNYLNVKTSLEFRDLSESNCEGDIVCGLSTKISNFLEEPQIKFQLQSMSEKVTDYITNMIYSIIISLPNLILNLFVIIFLLFFFIRDGPEMYGKLKDLSPLKKAHTNHLLKRINEVTYAVVYGFFLIALAQGFLGGLAFYLFDFSAPFMWGIIMMFLSILPFVGPPLIWLPFAIIRILQGHSSGNGIFIFQGIMLIVWGIFVLGTIDNVLKPKLIGHKAKIHPIVILLGVLGGLKVFGVLGIIIGPLVLAVLVAFFQLYEEDKTIFVK